MRSLRVLHLPTDTGGHAGTLARAEQALGARSRTAVWRRSSYGYEVDVDLRLGDRSKLGRLAGRAGFMLRSLPDVDVIHGNFGQAFLPSLRGLGPDLALWRAAGRGVFMTFQGCDARQRGWCRAHRATSCCGDVPEGASTEPAGLCATAGDAAKQRAIRAARRWCHGIFCVNPDLLEVVPGATFLPYASVDLEAIRPIAPDGNGVRSPLRLVHAPTNRAKKGTADVLALPGQLADRGIECTLDLVEGVDRAETLRRLARADLVIDQLRIGWYGGLAAEAMALGRPVVARLDPADRRRIPAAMDRELPVIDADAGSLADVVAGLAGDRARLRASGRAGRRFVERWHDPVRIAEVMLQCYRDRDGDFWSRYRPPA